MAELVTLAFGPHSVIGEEFRFLDALAVAIYGSWAARYEGVTGHPPHDVDVLVIGEVRHSRRVTGHGSPERGTAGKAVLRGSVRAFARLITSGS